MSATAPVLPSIEELVSGYHDWLRDRTVVRKVSNWTEITTPFLDRHNDYIQIYARQDDGAFLLTDDGYTISDLEMSGCNLDSPKRRELLQTTLGGFGVKLKKNDVLEVHATAHNFPLQKHNLIQAILAVNDLFYLATATVKNLFFEDVSAWLDSNEVRFLPRVKLAGVSGFDHVFDFAIPKSSRQPERFLKAITNPNRDTAQSFAFAWMDTRKNRPHEATAYAVINDQEKVVLSTVTDALGAYGIHPLLWSERANAREIFAA